MKKRNVLVFVLSLLLMIGMLPGTVFADAPPPALWVNGIDITAAPANTVPCGTGTAVYDPTKETLTLNHATIDTGHSGNGIAAGDYFNDHELTVVLVGPNVIAPAAETEMNRGIYTFGELSILGEGSIAITTKTLDTAYTCGIYAWGGCSISDATISMTDESTEHNSTGIDVNMVGSYFLCEDATIQISEYNIGINVPTGHVNIDDSGIEIIGATRGVNGGTEIDDFKIKNSEIDCSVTGVNAVAVANGCDILIDHSKLTLSSTSSNAIFSNAALSIKNSSEIDATGYSPALYGMSAIAIENSEVEAVSTNNIGIFSRGSISITGGTVHAKGGTDFAAIAARVVKSGEEAATSKISLGDMIEENSGKMAVSDWFLYSSTGETRSWTSFIAADDSALDVDGNGLMTNALNEVLLTAFIPVTKISGGPVTMVEGADLTLTGNVEPANATNQTILWSVKDAGTTKAVITGNVLTTKAPGTVTVTAKIVNGASQTGDYTQDFNITVTEWENPFSDVKKSDWFYDNVANMVNRGLFKGVSEERFDPNETMSRAMFVTVLARLDGADLSSYQGVSHFTDVKQGTWYAPSVNWAYDKGIVSGVSDQAFSPNRGISRQEMAKITVVYADYAGITLPTDQGSGKAFVDMDKVASWAKTYVETAEKAGLLCGYKDGSFRPQNTSTRAEAATVFTRFEALK